MGWGGWCETWACVTTPSWQQPYSILPVLVGGWGLCGASQGAAGPWGTGTCHCPPGVPWEHHSPGWDTAWTRVSPAIGEILHPFGHEHVLVERCSSQSTPSFLPVCWFRALGFVAAGWILDCLGPSRAPSGEAPALGGGGSPSSGGAPSTGGCLQLGRLGASPPVTSAACFCSGLPVNIPDFFEFAQNSSRGSIYGNGVGDAVTVGSVRLLLNFTAADYLFFV